MSAPAPDLRQPMEMGQILERALAIYRQYPGPLLLMATVALPVYLLTAALTTTLKSVRTSLAFGLPLGVLSALITIVVAAAIARGLADVSLGIAPDFWRSYDLILARLPALFLAVLRASLLLAVSCVTVVGPVYLAVRWAFLVQAVVLEDARPGEALTLSSRMVSGYWWRTCRLLLAIGILAAVPGIVSVIIFALAPVLVWTTILPVMAALVLPFAGAAYTLLFFDLQAREASRVSIA